MAAAFARCQSEAQAAFGDGSVFVEKLIARPRHIEVQILADADGNIVHLYERDCSVQLRNQKVVEIAPAPGLDAGPARSASSTTRVTLARAAGLRERRHGRVPGRARRRGEHFFIECNPRIQVEHTVTEQVTGIDLVEAQFRIAAGETLTSSGPRRPGRGRRAARLRRAGADRRRPAPARSPPTRSRAGPGVRVDACGYLGYAPPPQFDPMFAKLIGQSNSTRTLRLGARPHAARAGRIPHRRPADQPRASCARSCRIRRCAPATRAPPCSPSIPS